MVGRLAALRVDKALRALERKQRPSPGNLCHTVLLLWMEHGKEETSETLAERAAASGQTLHAAFRKQLQRARACAGARRGSRPQTLEALRTQVEEELIELGL